MTPRWELVGTRKLARKSLRIAVNESRPIEGAMVDGVPVSGFQYRAQDAWLYDRVHDADHWPSVEALARGVERHVITHQMRQVYALLTRIAGKTVAAKLARAWTIRGDRGKFPRE